MALNINDIIKLVEDKQKKFEGKTLNDKQITEFILELQSWIKQMDFTLPEGTTIVAYSGEANSGDYAWEIAREISAIAGDNAVYIRDTPPGELLNDREFTDALKSILGKEKYEMVCNGCDSSGKRIPGGGCGFGNNVQSLADFISGQFMQRASGTSSNIVVLVPKGVIQDKVFAVTELKQIFENENFNTINGISKENLKSIYNSGEAGRNAVYNILKETSQRALGDNVGVADQAKSLYQAIGEYGILNESYSPYTISGCYDVNGSLIGIQLDEKGKGTIIEPPKGTVYKSEYANTGTYMDEAKMAELFGEDRYKNLSDYEKKQAADLSNKLDKFLSSTDSQDGTAKDTTVKGNTVGDTDTKQGSSGSSDSTSDSGTKHTGSSDSDGTKSNTGESSDKSAGAHESSGGDDAGTKHTGTGDDGNVKHTGTGDDGNVKHTRTGDDGSTKHTGTSDTDIKEAGTAKHTGSGTSSDKSASSKHNSGIDIESESTKRYLAATGKTADELNDIDKAVLKIADKFANNPKEASEFAKTLSKYDDIIKVGENIGGVVDAICTAIYAGKTIYDAYNAYKNGDTDGAIGIVTGALTEFAVSTIGGMAITGVISPYLIGFGAAIGGPVGAAIGGIVAGLIGYGLAGWGGAGWNEMIQEWFAGLDEADMLDAMTVVYDPLILDLNGDGNYTKQLEDGTHFDFMGDGFAEKMGWVSEEDGLLVHDLNKNGIIDDGSELFGDMTQMSNGEFSDNGFQALSDLDSNGDGVINKEDALWSELQVWQDKNSDGISQADELYTLEELGIQQLNLDYTSKETDDNGNLVTKTGSYVTDDNITHTMAEVSFVVDSMDTVQNETVDIPQEIEDLPDLRGSGTMGTLHQAMAKNEELKNMVQEFVKTTDGARRGELIQDIVKGWANCGEVEPGSRGSYIDAEHLAIIEKFFGRVYEIRYVTPREARANEKDTTMGIIDFNKKGDNPNASSAVKLEDIYAKLLADISRQLVAQTDLKLPIAFTWIKEKAEQSGEDNIDGIFTNIYSGQETEAIKESTKEIDYTFAKAFFTERLKEDVEGTVQLMREYTRFIKESKTFKEYFSLESIQQAFADSGVLLAAIGTYDNIGYYYGTNGQDNMSGKANCETFFMGAGDDVIRGNAGNDTLYGESGNDKLYGGNGDDILIGGIGNDYMEGGKGADTYIHNLGDGDDIIYNYDTSEERVKDRLVFGEGIRAEDIRITREGSNMVLTNTKTGEKVTVQNAYSNADGRCYLENIEFADGTVWTREEMQNKISVITGTEDNDTLNGNAVSYAYTEDETFYAGGGDDVIRGNAGNDTLYGEAGNDKLYGGNGDDILIGGIGNDYMEGGKGADTYIHNLGDGDDIIYNYDTSEERVKDRLVFGEGISAEDILITREGTNMVLTNTKTGEKVTVQNAYSNADGSRYLENIEFADGTVWTREEMQNKISVITGTEDNDTLNGNAVSYAYTEDETFYAGGGDDVIRGNAGNDTLYGEAGNDKLYGGNGDDILIGGIGNDYMEGGKGADTYIHNLGDGDDIIYNYDTSEERVKDRLVFGEGISAEDIRITREGTNMVLTNTKTGEKVTVQNAYSNADGRYYLENIEFADGTVWTREEMQKNSVIVGTEGNNTLSGYAATYGYSEDEIFYSGAGDDTIWGYEGNDVLYGEDGNDKLYGGNGNDTLVGGSGNDYLEGGNGADTYIHNLGDGDDIIYNYDTSEERVKDRLVFGEGIRAEDIRITREGTNMVLTNTETGEKVTVQKAYSNADGKYYLENIEFADGTVWTRVDVQNKMSAIIGSEGNDNLYGYTTAYGYSENETFYSGAGDDTIWGYEGNDVLYGEDGNDKLYGGNGNDTLVGGVGNDYMEGGNGADLYIHNLGDGNDIINNYDTSEERVKDRLVFGEGIRAEDIRITREGANMVLTNTETGEKVTVQNAYSNADGSRYLENIEFADGTVWTREEIQKNSVIVGNEGNNTLSGYAATYGYSEDETFYGGIGNDTIRGNEGNDVMYGEAGDDKLYGGNGNDTLVGGSGNDYLEGGNGADLYIHNFGDGNDIINNYDTSEERVKDRLVFGEGIRAEDIRITREGANMVLTNTETGEKVTVQNAYSNADGSRYLENIEFADGTVWTREEIQKNSVIVGTEGNNTLSGYAATYGYSEDETFYGGIGNDTIRGNEGNDVMYGEAGDDKLYGGNGNDTLVGGTGNDYLYGGTGNDTYIFNKGDGCDVISDVDSTVGNEDILQIGTEAKNLSFTQKGSNLLISLLDTEDTITINNWYQGDNNKIETINSVDGYTLSHTQVDLLIQSMASFESTSGMSWSEGVRQGNADIDSITAQIWVKQVG